MQFKKKNKVGYWRWIEDILFPGLFDQPIVLIFYILSFFLYYYAV